MKLGTINFTKTPAAANVAPPAATPDVVASDTFSPGKFVKEAGWGAALGVAGLVGVIASTPHSLAATALANIATSTAIGAVGGGVLGAGYAAIKGASKGDIKNVGLQSAKAGALSMARVSTVAAAAGAIGVFTTAALSHTGIPGGALLPIWVGTSALAGSLLNIGLSRVEERLA